jgi:hypothetical protein
MRTLAAVAVALAAVVLAGPRSDAGEIGHYSAGLVNVRDLAVPDPGFYVAVYNYGYTTDRVNDRHGEEIDALTLVGPRGRRLTIDLDVDVEVYALAPMLMWVSPWKVLGAKVGAYVAPTFSNTSIGAALSTITGRGLDAETGQFGVGDLYVQPIWLGWTLEHFDFAFGAGAYAPVGKYDVQTVRLPRLGSIDVESADNIGLGFWTGQTQVAGYWYPMKNKATALGLGVTHEIHGKKEDFDLRPGQDLSLNWGISQFLPLTKSQALLVELGPLGYDTWQITDDDGDDVRDPSVRDEVHAVGAQAGLTYVPWNAVLNFHWLYEYAAKDRFEGQVFALTLAKKF